MNHICPDCGADAYFYDRVRRIVRSKGGQTRWIEVDRFRCSKCRSTHRILPSYILPYKHYEVEIINGVVEGLITCETLGYEDYPCEMTMKRWQRNISKSFYEKNHI